MKNQLLTFAMSLAALAGNVPAQTPEIDIPALPEQIILPPFTAVTVKPTYPPRDAEPTPVQLLWRPRLEEAVFIRGESDIQARYRWEGDQRSEAFQIRGVLFDIASLEYPDEINVTAGVGAMSLMLNQNTLFSTTTPGSFPGIFWYSPAGYHSTVTLDGKKAYLIHPASGRAASAEIDAAVLATGGDADTGGILATPEPATPENALFLDAETLFPLRLIEGGVIYNFSVAPRPGFKPNPTGKFLEAINRHFQSSNP